jgi:hypothetical protein
VFIVFGSIDVVKLCARVLVLRNLSAGIPLCETTRFGCVENLYVVRPPVPQEVEPWNMAGTMFHGTMFHVPWYHVPCSMEHGGYHVPCSAALTQRHVFHVLILILIQIIILILTRILIVILIPILILILIVILRLIQIQTLNTDTNTNNKY